MTEKFLLDRELILDRLGGDEEIFAIIADLYLQEVDLKVAALGAAWEAGATEELIREAHTIKGLLATFSDDIGAAWAYALEQQVRLGELGSLQSAVGAVQQRLFEVAAVLRREFGHVAG